MPDASGDLGLVALDLHPPTPPIAELTTGKLAIARVAVEFQAGRQTLDDAGQPGAMRHAGFGEPGTPRGAPG
jgi:hypothetical protein